MKHKWWHLPWVGLSWREEIDTRLEGTDELLHREVKEFKRCSLCQEEWLSYQWPKKETPEAPMPKCQKCGGPFLFDSQGTVCVACAPEATMKGDV